MIFEQLMVEEYKAVEDPIKQLIVKYKEDLRQNKLSQELYKWNLLNEFRGRPNLNAPDFTAEIKSIKYSNLIYGLANAVMNHLGRDRPEPYRECFRIFFDESLPLADRMKFFTSETLKIYRELVPNEKIPHHHDERTMATILTFYNPDKYALYKDSFYQKYCRLLDIKPKGAGEKYPHYLSLLDDFISNYINQDQELLHLVQELLPEDTFQDTNHRLLAQDILYRMLDKGDEEAEKEFSRQLNKNSIPDLNVYFHTLDKLIAELSIPDETNLVFSAKSGQLSFQIGRRYCLTLNNGVFSFIAPENYVVPEAVTTSFSGGENPVWINEISASLVLQHYPALKEAVSQELYRKNNILPKEYDNPLFRKAAFDKSFRLTLFEFKPIEMMPDSESRIQKKKLFLAEWPKARIENLNIDEYTNIEKTSFCYWVEAKTEDLGSIWGGSAFKFGIYRKKNPKLSISKGYDSDSKYAWATKYGKTVEEAFQTIKKLILDIIDAAELNELGRIDSIDLGPAYKWKIAFLYSDYKIINIYKTEALQFAAESLGMSNVYNSPTSSLHNFIISKKPASTDFFQFARGLWQDYENSIKETELLAEPGADYNFPIPEVNHKWFALNQILYGPPGTGKTYTTVLKALEILGEDIANKSRKQLKSIFDNKVAEGQIVFTTFHQSMSYEDFIEGIKPETIDGKVSYSVKPGIFKEICTSAQTPNQVDFSKAYDRLKKDLSERDGQLLELTTPTGKTYAISLNSNDNLSVHTGPKREKQGVLTKENLQKQLNGEPKFIGWEGYFKGLINYLITNYQYSYQTTKTSQNYVLIIDEINRGNVSQIFGELITLIEEDKRLGQEEALEITLPYSKEKFGVPANLYIIGTMNTADRSVEALDTALRRRFSFVEMPPKYDLESLQKEIIEGFTLSNLLLKINLRIEKLIGKDNLIGHSYFLEVKDIVGLRAVFQNKILPLLQEYFYGDYGKIGLVLGEGFVKKAPEADDNLFAKFGDYDMDGLAEKEVYHLVNALDREQMPDDVFEAALISLMK